MEDLNIYNLKIGDKVIVNGELRSWIIKKNWVTRVHNLIGQTVTIKRMTELSDTIKLDVVEDHYWIPIQCVDPLSSEETKIDRIKWYKKGKLEK